MKKSSKIIFAALSIASGLSTATANFQFAAEPLWTLNASNSALFSATASTERGIGFNPVSGNVLAVSRNGGLNVHVINGLTGTVSGALSTTGISGGVFALSTIGVGSDGAIYGANLTTDSASSPFKIYRWADEASEPTVFFSGDPSGGDASSTNRRFGDNLSVSGSGVGTEILVASRAGQVVSVITDTGASPVTVSDATAGDFGLGVALGNNSDFFGTAGARPLSHVGLDGTIQASYGSAVFAGSVTAIGVDFQNNLLAGVRFDAHDVYLYDLSTLSESVLNTPLSIAAFPTANTNGNGTGSAIFGNNGILYALDTNNGIMALEVIPEPGTYALILGTGMFVLIGFRRFLNNRM